MTTKEIHFLRYWMATLDNIEKRRKKREIAKSFAPKFLFLIHQAIKFFVKHLVSGVQMSATLQCLKVLVLNVALTQIM